MGPLEGGRCNRNSRAQRRCRTAGHLHLGRGHAAHAVCQRRRPHRDSEHERKCGVAPAGTHLRHSASTYDIVKTKVTDPGRTRCSVGHTHDLEVQGGFTTGGRDWECSPLLRGSLAALQPADRSPQAISGRRSCRRRGDRSSTRPISSESDQARTNVCDRSVPKNIATYANK